MNADEIILEADMDPDTMRSAQGSLPGSMQWLGKKQSSMGVAKKLSFEDDQLHHEIELELEDQTESAHR